MKSICIINFILKLLWPEVCPFCGKVNKIGICPACREKLEQLSVKDPKCMRCGKPVRHEEQEYCSDCAHTYHYYDRGAALWLHKEPVSTSIYQFKYHNQRRFSLYYASEMALRYKNLICQWDPEVIIPVPLHARRRRRRGYNQSLDVARELGRLLGIPVADKLVVRVKNTSPQKQLGHKGREKNLRNAFALKYRIQGAKSVLLLDDIYTTGSTVDGVSKVLKQAGVEKVYFLTISIGQGY